ncbi:MAG: radical SAM protein [Ethanoligenens sp.]
MFALNKFSLIILTRCNLNCKLCCEYIPQNRPFPDMTVDEERAILDALFSTIDCVTTLHLTGGGEPFLHPQLSEMIECAMQYSDRIDRLMLFSNSTVPLKSQLLETLKKYKDRIVVQLSQYGINPAYEIETAKMLIAANISCKVEKYYGDNQSFGGWVDFGEWKPYNRSDEVLSRVFLDCAVTRDMLGNWRTRDGKVHWCTRSQRGMELGQLPDNPADYVDLFDSSTAQEKCAKFKQIAATHSLLACDYCSGNQGTSDVSKRFPAAEQI